MKRTTKKTTLTLLTALLLCTFAVDLSTAATVGELRCERLPTPSNLDVPRPTLSWMIASDRRSEVQTAYQVLVASSLESLAADKGDLWNSGKVASPESSQVVYDGRPLASRTQCFWKVRIWDRDGQPSAWSQPSEWCMGLLQPADWGATKWISDPILANPANRPLTPIHCYRSKLASRPDAVKQIVLDLGSSKRMDAMELLPARPLKQKPEFRTAMFPLRFKVEGANQQNFKDARILVDNTGKDFPDPRKNACRFEFPETTARYVRLTVTRLSCWDAQEYGIALSEFSVFDGTQSIAVGSKVECSDSMESDDWSKQLLVDGKDNVAFAPPAPALATGMPDMNLSSMRFNSLELHPPADPTACRVPMLRREFNLAGKIRRASLSVSARGFYEVRINGQRVGNELMAPGYTDYGRRLQFQTHDVTELLHTGTNAIGALLGYGRYAGYMDMWFERCIDGYFPQFLAQLDVELVDGKHVTLGTDGKWRSTLEGPVRWSDLLVGEGVDCRRDLPGWDQPGFDDRNWKPVWSQPRNEVPLVWQRSQPERAISELQPVAVKEVKPGVYVFDFGQNLSGWCRLKVDGPAGMHLRLRHCPLLLPDGNLDLSILWAVPQQEDYMLDGKGERTLEPHFTSHGFRYVELSGLTGPLKPGTLLAVHVRTDAAAKSQFECSNDLYNRIQKAALWTQANNIHDVPAVCPSRSERLAWTGDIGIAVQSALFNFDLGPLLTKYTTDIRDAQTPDGRFTDIAPRQHHKGSAICVGSPGWADVGVTLPWEVYLNTGDRRLLAEHYEAARRWVEVTHASNPDLLWLNNRGHNWGSRDWLSAEFFRSGPGTPKEIGATALFAHSVDLLSRMAQALGRQSEADKYRALFQGIREAYVKKYVSADGIIGLGPVGKPYMKDVTGSVRSLIKNGNLTFTVKHDLFGDNAALGQLNKLHIITRNGNETIERDFAEGSTVELTAKDGKELEIVSASYGYDDTGRGDTQFSYALALQFDLFDEPLRAKAAKRLAELVAKYGYHPTTGYYSIAVPLALSNNGYHAVATEMLNQRTKPSWGYMATQSTTLWEAFDFEAKKYDMNCWPLSAISEWFIRHIAGLNPDEQHPGYQSFTIRPRPAKEVTWCKASYHSGRGQIISDWKSEGGQFMLSVTIPANTTATVFIPTTNPEAVTESGKPASQAEGVTRLRTEPDAVVYQVGSGVYHFTAPNRLK